LVPKVLNAIDMIPLCADKILAVIDPLVMELGDIQHIIDLKAVHVDDTIRRHLLANNWDQRGRLGVWDDGGINFATRFNSPKTGTFLDAPRPRLPLRTPPK